MSLSASATCDRCTEQPATVTVFDEPDNDAALMWGDKVAIRHLCGACLAETEADGPWHRVTLLAPAVLGPPRRGRGRPAGVYGFLSDALLRECHGLYLEGWSLRRIAADVLPRTRFASHDACKNALSAGFRRLGLPRRGLSEAMSAANARRLQEAA